MPILEDEGSVEYESTIDSNDTETVDESQENINNSDDETATDSDTTVETETDTEGEPQKDSTTDKGTRLAEDPLSRANQLRANAEARLKQAVDYIQYMEKTKSAETKAPDTKELFLDASKIQTTEDLQKYADSLKQVFEEKFSKLETGFSHSIREREIEKVQDSVAKSVQEVQSLYPELREFNPDGTKNPSYNKKLDKELSDRFVELDFDENRGIYQGKTNIGKLANSIVTSYREGKNSGTESAKTRIIDKKNGAVKTQSQPSSSDEGFESAEDFIASAIKGKR